MRIVFVSLFLIIGMAIASPASAQYRGDRSFRDVERFCDRVTETQRGFQRCMDENRPRSRRYDCYDRNRCGYSDRRSGYRSSGYRPRYRDRYDDRDDWGHRRNRPRPELYLRWEIPLGHRHSPYCRH